MFVSLARKGFENDVDLSSARGFVKRDKEIWRSEIAIIFRDLVFENQMASKSIPRQFRYQTMILVKIVAVMRQDQIRRKLGFDLLEPLFEISTDIREKTIT